MGLFEKFKKAVAAPSKKLGTLAAWYGGTAATAGLVFGAHQAWKDSRTLTVCVLALVFLVMATGVVWTFLCTDGADGSVQDEEMGLPGVELSEEAETRSDEGEEEKRQRFDKYAIGGLNGRERGDGGGDTRGSVKVM